MDCIGRTYNIFVYCKENLKTSIVAQSDLTEYKLNKFNKIKDVSVCRSGIWVSPFDAFMHSYVLKELQDTIDFFTSKEDKRYNPLLNSLNNLKQCLTKPSFKDDSPIHAFNLQNDLLLNDLFTKSENEAKLLDKEKEEIENFKKEVSSYRETFLTEIADNQKYDFLKNMFLCEIEKIKTILDNFDKIRPEYILRDHWINLSFYIKSYCDFNNNNMLLEVSGKFNAYIFNFVKTYTVSKLFEKIIENAPRILLTSQ